MTPSAFRLRTRSDEVEGETWTAVASSRLLVRASSCRTSRIAQSVASSRGIRALLRRSCGVLSDCPQVCSHCDETTNGTRCVVVVDEALAPGLAANAAAVMALTLGTK